MCLVFLKTSGVSFNTVIVKGKKGAECADDRRWQSPNRPVPIARTQKEQRPPLGEAVHTFRTDQSPADWGWSLAVFFASVCGTTARPMGDKHTAFSPGH